MKNEETALNIDAFPPPKIAEQAETIGVTKANLDFWTLFVLAVLAVVGAVLGIAWVIAATADAMSRRKRK